MVKVCAITSSFPRFNGDAATGPFIFDLLKRLTSLGHKVCVVTPHQYGWSKMAAMDGIRVYRFSYMRPEYLQRLAYGHSIPENIKRDKLALFQVLTYMLSGTLKALRVLMHCHTDVIVTFWAIPQGLIGVILKRLTGRPLIVSAFPVEVILSTSRYKFMMPFTKQVLAKADLVIVNSNFTRRLVLGLGVRSLKTHVVYPGVDTEKFDISRVDDPENQIVPTDTKIVLTVARLVERKGIKYLVEAMPEILEAVPNTILLVVGDGPERSKLEAETARLNLSNEILFLGRLPDKDLFKLYAASDVFALPAVADSEGNVEGLGVVLLEAMSMGRAVVASRVGGISEAIVNGETGILVSPRDTRGLADAIISILQNPGISSRMGENGRRRAEQMFEWNTIVPEFSKLITSLEESQGNEETCL